MQASQALKSYVASRMEWYATLRPAIARFHLFSSPIPQDYQRLRVVMGDALHAKYAQIMYDSVDDGLVLPNCEESPRGDLLLGNSAAPTNNHIDALDFLEASSLEFSRLILPMSYGHNEYRRRVASDASRRFGDRVLSLKNVLPLKEYQGTLAGCGIALFAHRQQEALGNILMMLWSGAAVYLDEYSPVTTFLRELNVPVRTVRYGQEHSSQSTERCCLPVSCTELSAIQSGLKSFWGRENVMASYARFFDRLGER